MATKYLAQHGIAFLLVGFGLACADSSTEPERPITFHPKARMAVGAAYTFYSPIPIYGANTSESGMCYSLYSAPYLIGLVGHYCGYQIFDPPIMVGSIDIAPWDGGMVTLYMTSGSFDADDPTYGSSTPTGTAPEGVSQEEYDKLNPEEKALCLANPLNCYGYYSNANAALAWADSLAKANLGPDSVAFNNKYDAMRHALWSARLTAIWGDSIAKVWTDAHEVGATPPSEVCMDLFNNQKGREIFLATSPPRDNETVRQNIIAAADANQLQNSPGCP